MHDPIYPLHYLKPLNCSFAIFDNNNNNDDDDDDDDDNYNYKNNNNHKINDHKMKCDSEN